MSKRLTTPLRHGQLPREEYGTIEFWRLKVIFGTNLSTLDIGLIERGRVEWWEVEGTRRYFNTGLTRQDRKFSFRALQGHSGRNPIDPPLQDNVSILDKLLRVHLSYCMCNQFTLHHKFRIDTGKTKIEQRKTVFIEAEDKEYTNPYKVDLTRPRLAWYTQKTWKRRQDTMCWVEKQLAQR